MQRHLFSKLTNYGRKMTVLCIVGPSHRHGVGEPKKLFKSMLNVSKLTLKMPKRGITWAAYGARSETQNNHSLATKGRHSSSPITPPLGSTSHIPLARWVNGTPQSRQ